MSTDQPDSQQPFLKADADTYSGPEDLDEAAFLSELYRIDPSLQGKVAAKKSEDDDLIKTTLRIAFGEERASHHTASLGNSGIGILPAAVVQEVRADAESEDEETAEPEPEPEPEASEAAKESNDWDWDEGYVHNPEQDTYVFDLNCYPGPFIVEGERLRRMAKRYSKHHGDEVWHLDEVASAEGMAVDAWREIKNALNITHRSPGHLPEDFEEATEEDIENWVEMDVQLKKHKYKQENQERTRRELEKAAEKYFQLEGEIERVAEHIEETGYQAPQLNVRVSPNANAFESSCLVLNAQDYHLGNRPVRIGLSPDEYMDQLIEGNETILERAARVSSVEKIYLVIGGDLLNVDNKQGQTTRGTPQDQRMSTSELLAEAETFIRRLIDLCRQLADVELILVKGNHDEVLAQAIYQMALAHFDGADDVTGNREFQQRQHRTWRDHFLTFTHGDYANKIVRRLPQICMREARDLVAHTQHATIHSGHEHLEKVRFEKAGWIHQTAPAPVQLDEWHEDKGYTGGRRALQGTLHFEGGDDMPINRVLGRR